MSIATMESPIATHQFIWFAKYTDESIFAEFNDNKTENEFSAVDKKNIKEFGIMGCRAKLWFNSDDGVMKILNPLQTVPLTFEFALEDEKQNLIKLSGRNQNYNDIIQFHRLAKCLIATKGTTEDPNQKTPVVMKEGPTYIDQNNFGFKICIDIEGKGQIFYSQIFRLNFNEPCAIECRIAPTFDFNGSLITTFNNKTLDPTPVTVLGGKSITMVKRLLTNGTAR